MTALSDGGPEAVELPDPDDAPPTAYHEYSYADLVERLFSEFESQLSLPTIVETVRECRQQLRGSPAGALLELTERLARQRLSSMMQASLPGTDKKVD
jgi:hypothetical protein